MNKAQAKLRCRGILESVKGKVDDVDALWLLTNIFPRHPDWEAKQGAGVSHVEVRVTGTYKSNGFWLVRTDGTSVDISYKVSLDGRGTDYAQVTAAARQEILGQISSWKRANVPPNPGMHCDHVQPFDIIFKGWLETIKLRHEEIHVTNQLVGHAGLFLSREAGLSWQRYHKQHASYQWLDAKENIRKSNKVCDLDDWLSDYENASAEA